MPRVPSVTHRYTRVPQSARRMEVHAGTLGYVGISGEGGRVCAPGGRQRTDSLRGFPAGNAGDTGGSESPPGPTRPHPGPGGVSPPDPLAEALAPSAAQRACIRLAAETQRRDHQARADRLTAELEQARTSHVAAISERDGKITTLTASQTALEARLAGMTLNALKTPFDAVATTWDGALKECGGSYEAAMAQYPQLAADYQKTHSGK